MNIEKGIAWSISGQLIDAYAHAYTMHTWRQACLCDKGSNSVVLALGFESAISIRYGAEPAVQDREKRMEGKRGGMIGDGR